MSITAVVRRRARPGEGTHLIVTGVHLLEERATRGEPLGIARVFQSLSTPDDVLFVSGWDHRAAYWASLQAERAEEQLAALSVGAPKRYFFRQLALDENPDRSVAVVDCAILQSAPAQAEALLTDMRRMVRPMMQVAPGFVLRYLGQDEDHPTRVIILRGWESLEVLENFRRDVAPRFEGEWYKHGARVERFMGYSRAMVEGGAQHGP
jgi:quinol monooxygenase YgiN